MSKPNKELTPEQLEKIAGGATSSSSGRTSSSSRRPPVQHVWKSSSRSSSR